MLPAAGVLAFMPVTIPLLIGLGAASMVAGNGNE
jgi:hypothetical protein